MLFYACSFSGAKIGLVEMSCSWCSMDHRMDDVVCNVYLECQQGFIFDHKRAVEHLVQL